jgi:hypothetical protein
VVVAQSPRHLFSGSFRETMTNDWRTLVPKRPNDPFANDSKIDDVVLTHNTRSAGRCPRSPVVFHGRTPADGPDQPSAGHRRTAPSPTSRGDTRAS